MVEVDQFHDTMTMGESDEHEVMDTETRKHYPLRNRFKVTLSTQKCFLDINDIGNNYCLFTYIAI